MQRNQFETVLMTMTPRLNSLETMLTTVLNNQAIVLKNQEVIFRKLDQILYEEDLAPQQPKPQQNNAQPKQNPDPFTNPEIYTRGQRVPYSKLSGDQIYLFRDFLSHIRMNSADFSDREVDYASFADKNFNDIRLSDNSKRILQSAYHRVYGHDWSFTFIKGYLHKLGDDKAWSWEDGSCD